MNMYIFCKITKKIWFGGFNADNYEETIISFFFPVMHTGPVIFIQNIMNVALNMCHLIRLCFFQALDLFIV